MLENETELDDLFALGSQFLCDDYSSIPLPYDDHIVMPSRPQKPCLSTAEKKRQERNAREKERSLRITKQIDELKELLMSSGIKIKKQSKYAILMGATEYLQDLQKQSVQLCNDLGKLAQDHQTGIHPRLPFCSSNDQIPCMQVEHSAQNERLSFLLQGEDAALHAQKTFDSAPLPLAIVDIDGKFLEMNAMFVKVSRLPLDYLHHVSLFKLIEPSCLHDSYAKIAEMMLPVHMSMDGSKLCRPHHTHKNHVFFDRPLGSRSDSSRICLPGWMVYHHPHLTDHFLVSFLSCIQSVDPLFIVVV